MKIQVKNIPIYSGKLIFIDTENTEKFRKLIPLFLEGEDVYAHAVRGDYKGTKSYFIVINSKNGTKLTHNTISHEAFHITSFVMNDAGVVGDYDNDEASAYLIGYIVQQFYNWCKKEKIEIHYEK